MIRKQAIGMAILAAVLFGTSAPLSKLLLEQIPPLLMAALLYLGAGLGMLAVNAGRLLGKRQQLEARLTKRERPAVVGMILLDSAAPIFLMLGLKLTTAESVALLNNFEIVATSLIALFFFREAIGRRMWLAIFLITMASVLLSIGDIGQIRMMPGAVFVLLASICWGLENNLTRVLSLKDPLQIVVIKGFGSGFSSLLIAFAMREIGGSWPQVLLALLLGFVAYGLSIFFYIRAQRELGAARTSAYYAAAPFIGVLLAWLVLREAVTGTFLAALLIMGLGTYLAVSEKHSHTHAHEAFAHEHKHSHQDGHHTHTHKPAVSGEHSHLHTHEAVVHRHAHTPDLHHRHKH